MKECDPLAFGSNARRLIYQPDAGRAAAVESAVQVIDSKAHVVNSRPAAGDETANRILALLRFQKLHQRLASFESDDAGAIRIAHVCLAHSQYITVKRKLGINRRESDANVGNSSSLWVSVLH